MRRDPGQSPREQEDGASATGGNEAAELQAREARAALASAAAAGVHRVAVPTPFKVGRVNAYLIEDRPLTLIDAGPSSPRSLEELERGLAALGHRVEDLELLIVSHQHIDHFGLAATLTARSGARVAALAGLDTYLEGFPREAELDDAYAAMIMARHGVPGEVVETLRTVTRGFREWGSAVRVDRSLSDGELIELAGRSLRVMHRPGHSPTDTVFWDEQRGMLLAADHLIGHISSNPLLTRPPGTAPTVEGPRPQELVTYMDSLSQTAAMDLELVLPGHGDPVTDHRALIAQRMALHERRAERIMRLIAERPRTAHEIAQEIWGNVAVTEAYLTLSEVLGHVDLLLNADRIAEEEREGRVVLRPS